MNSTNGQGRNFNRRSLEVVDTNDSNIPEPQILGQLRPEAQPVTPKIEEIDKMYNLILSSSQDDKNKFAQEYLKRKIDRRLKEIEEFSAEK
jgi:hypothetical protein